MAYIEGLYIVLLSLGMALLSEGISWLLVYRTDDYKTLKDKIAKGDRKLERAKDRLEDKLSKSREKKHDKVRENLKADKQAMHVTRLKATVVNAALMLLTYAIVTHLYDERVLARLPYEPISYVTRITNRGLEARPSDSREVSVTFIYILCSLCVRGNVQKFFGNGPPKQEHGWSNTTNIFAVGLLTTPTDLQEHK